jgi:hypothetical protein
VRGAAICPSCFQCRGELEVQDADGSPGRYRQRCGCERATAQLEKRWPRYDFNTYIELCRCCGIAPLRSGSRWSVFFCAECKERVFAFNRAHDGWVVPIGRHTAMHGIGFNPATQSDVTDFWADVTHFWVRMKGLFGAIHILDERARVCVAENLAALGFEPRQEVPLADYLEAAAGRIDKAERFEALVRYFVDSGDRADGAG